MSSIALNNRTGRYSHHYNWADHLGNVRYTFDIYNGAVRRLQQDDYYPFALRKSVSPVATTNKYLYNCKEVQDELGGQYDYGARFYDPVIARWNVPDPLQEDEYWSDFDDAYAQEMSNEGYDFDASEGRKNAGNYFNLPRVRNVITAGNSAIHYNSSPYACVFNNPLSYIDPLGLDTAKVNQLREVTIKGNKNNGY
ncbi:hypothetical protein EA772_01205 [Pedobacter sp. G11]|uniref:RHS repeat-associated core domain-containing protein n=1 Tax=Pedobacter sp. G11 TaxID=2482728 RepID=UPI000F5F5B67|nr:RHS repeat-associated core domain-containing protein [Pedobacter sp. G11]AZI24026.1 hypothetical protein EA772_01205 [Pedobacter sp. G11]